MSRSYFRIICVLVAAPLSPPLLAQNALPAFGAVVGERTIHAVGVTELKLANGVRVLLKPMPAGANGLIHLRATRSGGLSLASEADYPSAAILQSYLSGYAVVGNMTPTQLRDSLTSAGISMGVGVDVELYAEGVRAFAGTGTKNLDVMLRVVSQYFSPIGIDSVAIQQLRNGLRAVPVDARRVVFDSLIRGGHPFGRPLVGTVVDSIDLTRTLAFYRSRFGNAAGFTFVLTGPFTLEEARPLVVKYLGGLQGRVPPAPARDRGVRQSPGPVQRFVAITDIDPAVRAVTRFAGLFPDTTPTARMRLGLMVSSLRQRLVTELRDKGHVVDTVFTSVVLERDPVNLFAINIEYATAPGKFQEARRLLHAEIDRWKREGPTVVELKGAQDETRSLVDLVNADPGATAERMVLLTVFRSPLDVDTRAIVATVTPEQLRDMARQYLMESRRIEVAGVPEAFMNTVNPPAAPSAAP